MNPWAAIYITLDSTGDSNQGSVKNVDIRIERLQLKNRTPAIAQSHIALFVLFVMYSDTKAAAVIALNITVLIVRVNKSI